ncbi:hypothetical protein BJV82DRAFT_204345 [Fennellomyces sp. T-0311]|nr:hypothetical protein BJV82DRAFT_204345 [Fennellomyces sp. T-0311]
MLRFCALVWVPTSRSLHYFFCRFFVFAIFFTRVANFFPELPIPLLMTDDRLRLPVSTSFNILLPGLVCSGFFLCKYAFFREGSSSSLGSSLSSSSFLLFPLTLLPLVSPKPSLEKPCLTTDSVNSVLLVCSGLSSAAASKSPIGASRSTVTLGAYVVLGYPSLLP